MDQTQQTLPGRRRKRIAVKHQYDQYASPFSESKVLVNLHDLEQKCAILTERNARLTERVESYNLLVQKANSEKIRLERKIKGVLEHINSTMAQQVIPGAKVLADPIEQQNSLLQWKLNVIHKYLNGIFPEYVP
ncbi:MAG TPA: hypothetical protein VIK74_11275 [Parasegetibacter sp.]|jgi:hypothetical protein